MRLRNLLAPVFAVLVCACVKDFREPECNYDPASMRVLVECFGDVPIPACCVDGAIETLPRPMCTEEGANATCAMGRPMCIAGGELGSDC